MTELIEHIILKKPYLVDDARDWAKDCSWSETEYDPDNSFIDRIPDERLLKLIHRHYDGGLPKFVKINDRNINSNTILQKIACISDELENMGFFKEAFVLDDVLIRVAEYNAPRAGKKKKRWSIKYKKSINCNNPKGFSQKQYCKRKRSGG